MINLTEMCWPCSLSLDALLWPFQLSTHSSPLPSWLPAFSVPCPHSAFICLSESPSTMAQAVSTVGQRHDCESMWVNGNSLSDTGTAGSHVCPHPSTETWNRIQPRPHPGWKCACPLCWEALGTPPPACVHQMCWWAWMGWRGESLACLHLSAELMGRERWGRPPPMLSTSWQTSVSGQGPWPLLARWGSCLIGEWMGVPLAWQTEGL